MRPSVPFVELPSDANTSSGGSWTDFFFSAQREIQIIAIVLVALAFLVGVLMFTYWKATNPKKRHNINSGTNSGANSGVYSGDAEQTEPHKITNRVHTTPTKSGVVLSELNRSRHNTKEHQAVSTVV